MFRHKTTWRTVKFTRVLGACLVTCSLLSVAMIITNTGGALTVPRQQSRDDRHRDDVIGAIIGAPANGRDRLRVLFEHDRKHSLGSVDGANREDAEGGGYPAEDYHEDNEDNYYDTNMLGEDVATNGSRLPQRSWPVGKLMESAIDDKVQHANDDGDGDGDGDDDDDDDDGGDDDKQGYADKAIYHYDNPPFKRGDFDYDGNAAFPPPGGELQKSNVAARNSLKYNSGQYKSMHLLENSQKTANSGRTRHNLETDTGKQPRTVLTRRQANSNSKDRTDTISDNNALSSYERGFRRRDASPRNFGYRKDGVSYPSRSNYVNRDRIETQIPLQNGDVTSWLLQEPPATQIQTPELPWQPGEVRSPGGIPLIVDKIFWSQEVESLIAKGITNEDFEQFLHKLQVVSVAEMHPPQWNRCGRPNNQYIVLQDGTPLCARFRDEHVKLLHGELLSFSLSRVLGLDNVPIVMLSEADTKTSQWRDMNISKAGWNESSIVALIQWIHGLDSERSRVKMPAVILEAYEKQKVFSRHHNGVISFTANDLTELVQWSDMILFDYLTGHYDRVASMQDGADREQKPSIMHENIRNLRKVWQTGKLWLIDNESGLFDGYELLYHGGEMGRKFVKFHRQMLTTNCVFRRQTVHKILELSRLQRPEEALLNYTTEQDPLYKKLPYANEMTLFKKYFHVRLKEVADWIHKCQLR